MFTHFKLYVSIALTLIAAAYAPGSIASESVGTPAGAVILDTGSFWRCRYASGTDVARMEDGKLVTVHSHAVREKVTKMVDGKKTYFKKLRRHPKARVWGTAPEGWRGPDFDDSAWSPLKGPFLIGKYRTDQGKYRSVPQACLRGRFQVDDPSKVKGLSLSVTYHGGIVVCVNGTELTRQHLPKGPLEPTTLAEDYPLEAFVDEEGFLIDIKNEKKHDKSTAARARSRLRELKSIPIPSSLLRKGVNVLALQLHRAPAAEVMFIHKSKLTRYNTVQHAKASWWSRVGISSIQLSASPGTGVSGHSGASGRPDGFQVWTRPIYVKVSPTDFGDPCDSPGLIRLSTARGGVCSGQVVASSKSSFKGLKVTASDLSGPGSIPASRIQLRYARIGWYRSPTFLELEDFPPAEISTPTGRKVPAGSGAVQPVWVTVRVPAEAKSGDYTGTVTVSADGQDAVDVPLKLRVVDWRMPAPEDFKHSFLEFIQSPESQSMHYKVEMWSDKHWKLLDRTFKLLGEVGNKVVYITAQERTHFGNPHSMIRYVKVGDGPYDYRPDFSIAEKYLDLALKHQGKMPVIGLYIWRSPWKSGAFAGAGPRGDSKILITVKDPKTGLLSSAEGPAWGTPECVTFWKPVIEGMKSICAERGVGASLMMGQSGDYTPSDTALADLAAAGGEDLLWIHHSHVTRTELGGMGSQPTGKRKWNRIKEAKKYPVGMASRAWGGDGKHIDPDFGRGYGWKNRLRPWRTVTREKFHNHPLPSLRVRLEAMVTNIIHPKRTSGKKDYGTHGIGRMGADFWNVLGNKRKVPLCGRYPENAWGQLKLSYCAQHFLMPGRDGAIGTAPLEMFRESSQEIEARVFIEKALEDKTRNALLGEELATRARSILDDRVRLAIRSTTLGGRDQRAILAMSVQECSEQLYGLVAEVARKLADK